MITKLVKYDPEKAYHDDNGTFFYDLDRDDLFCYLQNSIKQGDDMPEELYVAERIRFSVSAEAAVESALDEHYEDAYAHIPNGMIAELQEYIDDWCVRSNIVSYSNTYKECVSVAEIIATEKFVFEIPKK